MQQNNRHIEIKKRPDLSEVVRSLRASGRNDVADTISNLLSPTARQQEVDSGKFRFAYLFVNNSQASMDDQSKMIHGFMGTLKKLNNQKLNSILLNAELIPVTLPKGLVVLAMRVQLETYQDSILPGILEGHAFMCAYLRKPRRDTQHLASQQSPSKSTAKSNTTELQHDKGKGVTNA